MQERQKKSRNTFFPDTDKELLTEEDVKDLPAQLLAYGRYEILAKHGELFESEELKDYFGTQKWYFGFLADEKEVEGLLNDYEKENLDFLKKQEKAEGEYELDQKDFDYELVEKWLAGTYVPGEEEIRTGGQEAGTEKKEEESSGKKKAGAKKNSGKETEKAETEAPAAEVKRDEGGGNRSGSSGSGGDEGSGNGSGSSGSERAEGSRDGSACSGSGRAEGNRDRSACSGSGRNEGSRDGSACSGSGRNEGSRDRSGSRRREGQQI